MLLGHPVAHSLSPRFQNAAIRAAGLPARYDAHDVPPRDLPEALDRVRAERGAGNVTVPHKSAVAARCDVLTPIGGEVGAVNTFWVDADGRLVGDNTDVGGFDAAARSLVDVGRPQTVALIGAGGSAAAVMAALARWPHAQVRLWTRRAEQAAALAGRSGGATVAPSLDAAVAGATLIVNATPLGLRDGDPPPVPMPCLPPTAAVFDLAYAPARTAWVRAARRAGHPADDGLGMLVEQGALAFTRWFDRAPDRAAMWRALDDVLALRQESG